MKVPILLRMPKDVRAEVVRMTAPVILEQALISSMGLVGMMMASRLSEFAAAPIGMVDALHQLFILFFTSLGAGATVVVAQHCGRGELHISNEATRQSMFTSLLISLALVVILGFAGMPVLRLLYGQQSAYITGGMRQYLYPSLFSYPALAIVTVGCGVLRGGGDMRTPMKISVFMGALNTLLSWVLIYGLHIPFLGHEFGFNGLQLAGAGWALLISRSVAAAVVLYVLLKGQRTVHMRLRGFRLDMPMQKELFAIGVPVTAENVLFQVGKLITQVIVVACGTTNTTANVIANSIFIFVTIPGNAFSIAAMPIVGQSVGRGEFGDARERLLYVNWLSSLGLLLMCVAMMVFAHPLIGLFTTSADVAGIVFWTMVISAVFIPTSWSFSFVLSAGLKGAGDTKYSLATSFIGMWVFRVLLGYVLGILLHMGAVGIYLAMCIDWVVRGILYYVRLRGKKWYRNALPKPAEQE